MSWPFFLFYDRFAGTLQEVVSCESGWEPFILVVAEHTFPPDVCNGDAAGAEEQDIALRMWE